MPDADLVAAVTAAAFRLISASRSGDVEGDDIAAEVDAESIDVYDALREAVRRGDLECLGWAGGMGLPSIVRLPPV